MRNWIRCYTVWNVALNELGRPNIGPYSCGGLVTIDSASKVSYSGGYWALGHYSRAVHRGAVCVESHGDIDGLTHAAFVNPNGQKVVVVSNGGPQRIIALSDGARGFSVHLEADSVTTLMWH
jgi:glucosylceramidase